MLKSNVSRLAAILAVALWFTATPVLAQVPNPTVIGPVAENGGNLRLHAAEGVKREGAVLGAPGGCDPVGGASRVGDAHFVY